MPDANGAALPGEPGYIAPVGGATPTTGMINTAPVTGAIPASGAAVTSPSAPAMAYTPAAATAVNATGTGYTPNAFAVTPEQTASGQIKSLIDENSPLMQQAQTRAAQKMNERGLLNSSQAIGAGQAALYEAATPIATANAAAYNNAMTNTVNAQNREAEFRANAANTAATQNAQLGTNTNQFNAAAVNLAGGQTAEINSRADLAALQGNTSVSIADKQAATQKYLSDTDNASKAALAAIQANTTLTVADKDSQTKATLAAAENANRLALQDMQSSTNLSIADKQALTQVSLANADNAVKQRLADIQASTTLTVTNKQAESAKVISDADNNTRNIIANIQAATTLSGIDKQTLAQSVIANNENTLKERLTNLQNDTTLTVESRRVKSQELVAAADNIARLAIANIQSDTTTDVQTKTLAATEVIEARNDTTRVTLLNLQITADIAKLKQDRATKIDVAALEARAQSLLQTDRSSTELVAQTIQQMTAISGNKDMTQENKQTALDNLITALNEGLNMTNAIKTANGGNGLDFTTQGTGAAAAAAALPPSNNQVKPSADTYKSVTEAYKAERKSLEGLTDAEYVKTPFFDAAQKQILGVIGNTTDTAKLKKDIEWFKDHDNDPAMGDNYRLLSAASTIRLDQLTR